MKKVSLLMLGVLLACKGALDESPGEEVPQAEDPNTSATLPANPSGDAAAPPSDASGGIGKKDVDGSATAKDGASPAPDGGGTQALACAGGTAETEPNETAAQASEIAMGKNCGVAAPGDTDFWMLVDGNGTLEVDAASDDVKFALVDEQGLVMIPIFPGDPINFNANGSLFVRVTSKTKQSYSVTWE